MTESAPIPEYPPQTPPATLDGPIIVAIFNHKGGVGKTTSTAALGWKLASAGKRVLLVDGDPQCNLTGFLVDPGSQLQAVQQHLPPGFDAVQTLFHRYPQHNILDLLVPFGLGRAAGNLRPKGSHPLVFKVRDRIHLLPTAARQALKNSVLELQPPETLYLLPGSMGMNEVGEDLFRATEALNALMNRDCIGAIYSILKSQCKETRLKLDDDGQPHLDKDNLPILLPPSDLPKFDYVLVDLSPASNTLNKLFVMSAHQFVIPCSPDYFSLMGLEHMTTLLPQWDDWMVGKSFEAVRNRTTYLPPPHKPVFMGYTIQLFGVKGDRDNKGEHAIPVGGFQYWIDRIKVIVRTSLIPTLRRRAMALDKYQGSPLNLDEDEADFRSLELCQIRNAQTAGTISGQTHIPVWALSDRLVRSIGKKNDQVIVIRNATNTAINNYADHLINNWEELTEKMRFLEFQWALTLLQHRIGDQRDQLYQLSQDTIIKGAKKILNATRNVLRQ